MPLPPPNPHIPPEWPWCHETKSLGSHDSHYSTYVGLIKAGIIECCNRMLKEKLWQEFTAQRMDRSIGMKPVDVKGDSLLHPGLKNEPKAKVGDYVRIFRHKSMLTKSYTANRSMEIFEVRFYATYEIKFRYTGLALILAMTHGCRSRTLLATLLTSSSKGSSPYNGVWSPQLWIDNVVGSPPIPSNDYSEERDAEFCELLLEHYNMAAESVGDIIIRLLRGYQECIIDHLREYHSIIAWKVSRN
ncbi:hypothetical protein PR048_017375 [Dryococelus australis]|uniref:Uncharacterized protein n=1 Tax=Dryococelus australis TaxID=614101 RepID=A0ABQ9H9C0_9NEOP|nr:hypothetical protein PR048_017375 [Dryococelus australis]